MGKHFSGAFRSDIYCSIWWASAISDSAPRQWILSWSVIHSLVFDALELVKLSFASCFFDPLGIDGGVLLDLVGVDSQRWPPRLCRRTAGTRRRPSESPVEVSIVSTIQYTIANRAVTFFFDFLDISHDFSFHLVSERPDGFPPFRAESTAASRYELGTVDNTN